MAKTEIPFVRYIEDDDSDLKQAIRQGLPRPLLLWGHPEVGQSALIEDAAETAGLRLRSFAPEEFESWDGFRDVSESGHFREMSLEKFLARGERADPGAYTLASRDVLYLRDLNLAPTRLVQAVFEQILDQGKLLNNPIPADVRIIATARPPDKHTALELLGEKLRQEWERVDEPTTLRYATFPLPKSVLSRCDHWAVFPSVPRFLSWGKRKGLAEEVLAYLGQMQAADPDRAAATLGTHLLRKPDLFPQMPSPRAFADLGMLLVERQPCFSSRAVKEALARVTTAEAFLAWLSEHVSRFDADHWIEASSSLTLRGESVPGSVWLRNVSDQVRSGEVRLRLDDIPIYAAYERRSLEMWATQELGDELGREFVQSMTVTESDLARLQR